MRTKQLQVSISIPDIASLGDDDMPAIAPFRDGRWSNQTKELLAKFGTHKLDLNRGWASTWTEWSCPCCKRHKRQIVRLAPGGVLLCHLELHHDHLDDLVKKLFEEILSRCDDPEIRVQISRAEGALRPLAERFECTLICADCNLADGRVKRELRDEIEPHFTFTPSEIAGFISVSDNRVHEVDFERARAIWTEEKQGLADRVDFARRMATRIAKGRHNREVAPGKKLQGQPQARDILFRLCEAELPDIHSLHLGASIEARSVARDGVGRTQKPAKRDNVKPPTDAEFAMLDPSQPVRHARDAALAVFADMLFADPAHGDFSTSAIGQGQAEDTFGLKQALGMMTHGSVREEREVLFRGVKPIVHGLIVRRRPAELPGRAFGMMKRMGHLKAPHQSCASIRHSDPCDRA